VSGDAANVHGIGFVEAGTSYTITFDSPISLTAGVASLGLAGNQATSAFGTPDLRFTASISGSMVLYVGGRGQAGCYRYKVEIQPPSRSVVETAQSRASSEVALVKPAKYPFRTLAIAGAASSAKHCVTGNAAKIHGLGRIEQGDDVLITFASDFDSIAGVTLFNFNPERGTYLVDNDTGGNLEPSLHFTASQAGTLALHVGSVGGVAGCYRYQVQIQGGTAPAPSPTPAPTFSDFNGSWSGTFGGESSGTVAFTVANSAITVTQPAQGDGILTLGAIGTNAEFFTRAPTGECTWTGPFLPGGARQSSASGLWSCSNGRIGTWSANRTPPAPAPPPTTTGRYDGTYDFSYVYPQPGGSSTYSLPRFFIVRNGTISSTDGTVAGTVLDSTAGTVRFTAPCWTSSGGTATWTGTLTASSPKSGQGSYTCQNNINGGTWRVSNGT